MQTSYDLMLQCLRIRKIEEAICDEYSKLEMRTPTHISIGEESMAVGVISNLQPGDKVFGGHRSHAQYLAAGNSLKALIAELMGKATGCTGGYGGSMHLASDGMFVASTSIVGGTVPVAVGAAWAAKLKNEPSVVCVFFGDGCMEEGVVGESFNFAVLHQLPIVFVCSNNGLAVTTTVQDRHKFSITELAKAYGLETDRITSSDPYVIQKMSNFAIDAARQGKPAMIEIFTERERVHCGIEREFVLCDDCLLGYNVDETEIQREIAEAFEFARSSPVPANAEKGVFA